MYSEFPLYTPAIERLRAKVRHGNNIDEPQLMQLWLESEQALHYSARSIDDWGLYQAQFHLLLDAFADELVPKQWRTLAIDTLHTPLGRLQRLADGPKEQDFRRLVHELQGHSHYFQASIA